MLNRVLISGWSVTLVWVIFVSFSLFNHLWTGFVIALTGLVASLFVVGAFHSRSRKHPYPDKHA